jgi:hypothetical protein
LSGDLVVPRGEPLELVIQMSGLPRASATIDIKWEGVPAESAELASSNEHPEQFRYFLASLESSFRYRVQAGDGRTGWHSVTAIDRPALAEVKVTLTAPEYVDRPVYEKDYLPPRIQAVQGSLLQLRMRPAADLKTFHLLLKQPGTPQDSTAALSSSLMLKPDRDGWYRFETTLESDVTLTPELLSLHDLTNEDRLECAIRVIPDRAPVARVVSPTEEMAVRPRDVIAVEFEAHDDHGIAKAELIVYQDSPVDGEPPTILSIDEIPLEDQANSPHVLATAKLDLAKYEQLEAQFRGEVPEAVTTLVAELKRLMEAITFTQAAATFDLQSQRLREAESQQQLAVQGLRRAEELFDQIRRQIVEELDKVDPPDPNIADLEDPTLDELLERLEREPNLNALLGLPNRPRNLRVVSDFVASLEGNGRVPLALAQAAEQARQRSQSEEAEARRMPRESRQDDDQSEEEWRQVADAEQAQGNGTGRRRDLEQGLPADRRTNPQRADSQWLLAGRTG